MSEKRKQDPFLRACGDIERAFKGLDPERCMTVIERVTSPEDPGVENAVASIRRALARFEGDPVPLRRLRAFVKAVIATKADEEDPEKEDSPSSGWAGS